MSTAPIAALHGVGYNGGLDMSELREMMQKQQQEDTEHAIISGTFAITNSE